MDPCRAPGSVADTRNFSVRPTESLNPKFPLSAPVAKLGVPTVGATATSLPGSTFTRTVCDNVVRPLLAVTVNVSVEPSTAARRCAKVGV
jgi:hypothetical protein